MDDDIRKLQVFTFNAHGVDMAVDIAQIDRVLDVDEAVERGLKIKSFYEGISFHGRTAISKVFMIKDEIPFGILIDKPGGIVSLPFDSLRPLPALLSDSRCPKAIWGAALMNDEVVLLVDFYKLRNSNSIGGDKHESIFEKIVEY